MSKIRASLIAILLCILVVVFHQELYTLQKIYNDWWGKGLESGAWFVGVFGVVVGYFVIFSKYRGVTLVALKNGEEVSRRKISGKKAREIAVDEDSRSVVLKGFMSPIVWLNVDVLTIAKYDEKSREWRIDTADNPTKPAPPWKPSTEEVVVAAISELYLAEDETLEQMNALEFVAKLTKKLKAQKEEADSNKA
ncbi:hypothetical protein KKH43_01510 [Patescibacteria group bacterium]|nr:hypothetical protein [Patescibacteria group bacterium]